MTKFIRPSLEYQPRPLGLVGPAVAAMSAVTIVPNVQGSLLFVIALILAPVTLPRLFANRHRLLVSGAALWLGGVLLSAILHATPAPSVIANSFYPLATLVTAGLLIYLSEGSPQRALKVAFWAGAGLLGGSLFNTTTSPLSPLKLGAGVATAVVVIVALEFLPISPRIRALLTLCVGGAFIALDFRSMGVIILITAAARWIASREGIERRAAARQVVVLALITGALLYFVINALSQGWFGAETRDRFLNQANEGTSILQAARPESVVSLIALRASWIVGRGYGASLTNNEAAESIHAYATMGLPLNAVQTARIIGDGINSHSVLLTTWIATGLLGALGVALIAAWVARGALAGLRKPSPLSALAVFAAALIIWDFTFSPWAPRGEVWIAVACMVSSVTQLSLTNSRPSADQRHPRRRLQPKAQA